MEINLTPIVSQNQQVFKWNKDEIKSYFEAQLEKYKELVVTEDNYKDMVSAKNEIVKYRTTLDKFCKEKKRELKRPIELFEEEVNEVLKVVTMQKNHLQNKLNILTKKRHKRKQMLSISLSKKWLKNMACVKNTQINFNTINAG